MNNKQIDALIRKGDPVKISIDDGLYFRIARSKPSWVVRYTIAKQRKQITLPQSYPHCSIAQAKKIAAEIRSNINIGIDPLSERVLAKQEVIHTVNDLFEDWYTHDIEKRLKHPTIPARIYRKEIKPDIGNIAIKDVNPRHIRKIIQQIENDGRKSISNQALMYAKQLFRHAIKLNIIIHNPAQPFTQRDAGGLGQSRDRALTKDELTTVFQVLNANTDIFTRDNYLAFCMLLLLGVRKGELISAKWEHFDIKKCLWNMPDDNKTGVAITIPLPPACMAILIELHIRACGSEYLFPARRASKRRGYISDDTLNHALAKIFGLKVDGNKQPYPNLLGNAGIEHFTIHDLRRTCRSLLASLGVHGYIAERCLNHKLKGVEGIYNRHDYLAERKDALKKLSTYLADVINYNPINLNKYEL